MKEIRYTLITDGSSDSTLLWVIQWLFNDLYPTLSANGAVCDFGLLPNPPRNGDVAQRVRMAMQVSPYDICFYHRDAESIDVSDSLSRRTSEIKGVLSDEFQRSVVCVIPVKMMESWLLIDREAIKKAASNRNYDGNLELPGLNKLESHQNPKDTLHNLLRQATNNNKRRLKNFKVDRSVHLVAEYIEDYSPLRELKAFKAFEAEMKQAVDSYLRKNS
jgi:hypothetical protein